MPLGRGIGRGRVGRPGLVGTVARTAVIAGTASAVAGGVQRHSAEKQGQAADAQALQQDQQLAQQQEFARQAAAEQAAMTATTAPPPPAAAPVIDMDARIENLKKLAELRDAGVLNDAEFEEQKATVLNG